MERVLWPRLSAMAVLIASAAACRHTPAPMQRREPAEVREIAPAAPSFPHAPSPADPVVAVAAVEPARARLGDEFTLVVFVRTAPTWHIYAHEATGSSSLPTELALELPPGIEAIEPWLHPPSHPEHSSHVAVLEGSFEFRRKLRAQPGAAPGPREIACELTYQACDPLMCRPPERLSVRATLVVIAR
jgi:hypothetical protein